MKEKTIIPTLFCKVIFNENVGVFQDVVSTYSETRFIKKEDMNVEFLYMGVVGCTADNPDACLYGIDGFYAIRPDNSIVFFKSGNGYNPKIDGEINRLHKLGMQWYEILELMNL